MLKVHDDFLSKDKFDIIKSEMTTNKFPWFYHEGRVNNDDKLPALTHSFYDDNFVNSNWYNILRPIIDKCRMISIVRIKANFDYKSTKSFKTDLHTDLTPPLEGFKTGIFYLNDNDGKTYFENGEVVDSVANRFVEFPQHLKHGTQTHTDKNYRIIINFNWY